MFTHLIALLLGPLMLARALPPDCLPSEAFNAHTGLRLTASAPDVADSHWYDRDLHEAFVTRTVPLILAPLTLAFEVPVLMVTNLEGREKFAWNAREHSAKVLPILEPSAVLSKLSEDGAYRYPGLNYVMPVQFRAARDGWKPGNLLAWSQYSPVLFVLTRGGRIAWHAKIPGIDAILWAQSAEGLVLLNVKSGDVRHVLLYDPVSDKISVDCASGTAQTN